MRKYFILLAIATSLLSCSKEEGLGGLASISGKVYAKDYNSNGTLVGQGYLGDATVYISKSGDPNYFEKVNTSYDGSFKIKFLHKGTYDIWVFGDCDSCPWDQTFVKKTITISGTKEDVTTEDFIISI